MSFISGFVSGMAQGLNQMSTNLTNINAVVEKEILGPRVLGHPHFTDWKFHHFQSDPTSSKLVGKVSARRLTDNLIIWRNVGMYQDDVMNRTPNQLLNQLDIEIEHAVDFIIDFSPPHTPGVLCERVDCEECYS